MRFRMVANHTFVSSGVRSVKGELSLTLVLMQFLTFPQYICTWCMCFVIFRNFDVITPVDFVFTFSSVINGAIT